ncbi:dihydrofolate reductase-like domain-containing protein [Blastocladiella britannica]|nr:dihydrofolate reductase-like domain-containing protein [Blastocladiella britannica]
MIQHPLLDHIVRSVFVPAGIAPLVHGEPPVLLEDGYPSDLPWITVTWAQTLDGRISGPNGAPLVISGDPAWAMTHLLRQTHDSILIGAATLCNDNPKLNVRLDSILVDRLGMPASGLVPRNPQPVILDAQLTIPLTCHLLTSDECRRPWIVAEPAVIAAVPDKVASFEAMGARILPVARADGPRAVFAAIRAAGARSVMVEGGARVLATVLNAGLANAVVVTVAPKTAAAGTVGEVDGGATVNAAIPGTGRSWNAWSVVGQDVVGVWSLTPGS